MEIILAPESASRIRAVLGDTVDLSPRAVPEALARLAEEAPDVYSQVLNDLSGSQIRLDSERTLHRRHRRAVLRRALFGWGEYESDAGDRLLAKRRIAAAVPIGLAVVMAAASGLAGLLHHGHRASPRAAIHAPRASRAPAPPTASRIRHGFAGVAPAWSRVLSGRAAMAAAPAAARSLQSLPPVPGLPWPPPPDRLAAGGPPPSIVFSRVASTGAAPAQPNGAPPLSPIVYARDAGANLAGPRTRPPQDTADAPGTGATDTTGATPGASRKPGDRIAARLLTGIIVASGVPSVPVVADGGDGTPWLGRAAAEADGRVHISFTSPAAGVALDPEQLAAGLPGKLVVRRRAAAAVAIGALAQAAADYTQAVARAGQIGVAEGAAQVTIGGAAPGWTYAASRLADVLSPQGGGTVETLEVPAGTRCLILITGAP
jgi:hypothetical protein